MISTRDGVVKDVFALALHNKGVDCEANPQMTELQQQCRCEHFVDEFFIFEMFWSAAVCVFVSV